MSSTALQVMEGGLPAVQTSVRAMGLLRPLADPAAVLAVQNETRALVKEALKEGRDYGVIPGTDKPALLKPGAERLALGFGLAPRFRIVESEVDHDREVKWIKRKKEWRNQFKGDKVFTWKEEAGASIGLYRYVVECEMVHRDSGVVVASCLGSCSSMESKYVDRPRDVENTILKMGEKRAQVGAVILALGLSDEFTQDTEDLAANGVIDGSKPDPVAATASDQKSAAAAAADEPEAKCPKCQGNMFDNRKTKKNPKAPDYKCRDKECEGLFWPGQWPPKGPDETQTDAFAGTPATGAPAANAAADPAADPNEPVGAITADTIWPHGQHAGKKVRDLPIDFLKWAIQDDRKLGTRTADWQDAFSVELDERAVAKREAADKMLPGEQADIDAEKRKPRPRAAVNDDSVPF